MEPQSIESWSIDKVSEWLASAGLSHCVGAFQKHRISGDVLLDLSPDDLAEIGVHAVGDRKRILRVVALMRAPQANSDCCLAPGQQWDCAVSTPPHQGFCPQPVCAPQFVQNYGCPSFGFVHP